MRDLLILAVAIVVVGGGGAIVLERRLVPPEQRFRRVKSSRPRGSRSATVALYLVRAWLGLAMLAAPLTIMAGLGSGLAIGGIGLQEEAEATV